MGTITDSIAAAFRDFVSDGIPSSGLHEPLKAEVRALGPLIETAIGNAGLGALVSVTKTTKALLDADLAHAANAVALVYADATDANNDLYVKSGASGAGSWANSGILHAVIEPFTAKAQAWAESATAPGAVGTKSAKTWAAEAAASAALAATVPSTATPLNVAPDQIKRGFTLSSQAALDADRFTTGVNLFDASKAVSLSITTSTGGVTAHGSYQVTHLMRVEAGVSYRRSGGGAGEFLQWFDIDGTFISSTTASIATAPAGTYWARSSMPPGASNLFTREADWPSAFRAFKRRLRAAVGVERTTLDRETRQSGDRPVIHAQLLEEMARRFPTGDQLFDYTRVISGYPSTTGGIDASATYSTSHFIPVTAGAAYFNNAADRVAWFNENGEFISNTSGSALTAPAAAAFARFGMPNSQVRTRVFCAGTAAPSPFQDYQEALPLNALPRSLRPVIANQSLPLSSVQATKDGGAAILSGTLGVDAAIRLPFDAGAQTYVTCEFRLPDDVNSGYGEKVLMEIGSVKVGVASIAPTTGTYVPTWASKLFIEISGTKYYSSAITPQQLGLRYAFSIRKTAPTASDLAIKLEVSATHVTLFDGGTTLFSWAIATYATMAALIAQMRTDLGAAYEVRAYHADGQSSAALGRFSALLCKSQEGFNIALNAGTGATIYDSYETFVPLWDGELWQRLHVDFAPLDGSNYKPISLFLNGQRIYNNLFGATVMSAQLRDLYINSSAAGTDTYLGAPVRNLVITHDEPAERNRFLVVMNHLFVDGPEQDGVAPGGVALTITEGRARRFFAAARKIGWSFIRMEEFLEMIHGQRPSRDRVIVMTTDDSIFGYDTVPGVSNVFRQNNIKQCTGVIPKSFNFGTNAALLERLNRAGHDLAYHGSNHVPFANLSYAQFVAQMAEGRALFEAAGYTPTVQIHPYGSTTVAQGLWYTNNGIAAGFLASGNIGGFGRFNRMSIPRALVDDEVPWSTVANILNLPR